MHIVTKDILLSLIHISDIGSVAEIEKWAAMEESEVIKMQLVSQFRCNGSDGYLAWLDQALEIRETANYDLDGIDYDIRICDTPVSYTHLDVYKRQQCEEPLEDIRTVFCQALPVFQYRNRHLL